LLAQLSVEPFQVSFFTTSDVYLLALKVADRPVAVIDPNLGSSADKPC
jgi:hypothetical protein